MPLTSSCLSLISRFPSEKNDARNNRIDSGASAKDRRLCYTLVFVLTRLSRQEDAAIPESPECTNSQSHQQ
jgi:hypothetical protein